MPLEICRATALPRSYPSERPALKPLDQARTAAKKVKAE